MPDLGLGTRLLCERVQQGKGHERSLELLSSLEAPLRR